MKQVSQFQKTVRAFYRKNKRSLPWRTTKNPYHILVSEIMLQQTQVTRVIVAYKEFLKKFPTVQSLARATRASVLQSWLGLGYNRRAVYLHNAAKKIVSDFSGVIPKDYDDLRSLPGIGDYTARAIRTFAFESRETFIETNIRTVFMCHFFKNQKQISDQEILKVIYRSLPQKNISNWYHALMDYGSHLKALHPGINKKSAHYTKQTPFQGSNRQLRGKIVRMSLAKPKASNQTIARKLCCSIQQVRAVQAELGVR